jgi:hypothetical protein
VARAAADTRQAALAARDTARTPELATIATAHTWDAALAAWAAIGAVFNAPRTAVAVGVTATAAWLVGGDKVSNCSGTRR